MKKSKITITINANYGSEFQEENFLNVLNLTLFAITQAQKERHKQNKFTYSIEGKDL